ncbi:MAG: hypothetical protein ABI472_11775 [Ginsengibacter sp.]
MIPNKSLSYRYPGTKPFEPDEHMLFNGRDEDIENLYQLISLQNLVVLFGRSGLGKSSLLNAGLLNRFERDIGIAPEFLRFGAYHIKNTSSPLEKIAQAFSNRQQPGSPNFIFEKLIPREEISIHRLWYFFKNLQVTNPGTQKFILIFDQFEELFSYPEPEIELFKKEISELLYVSVPQQLRNLLKEKLLLDPACLTTEEKDVLFSPPDIRVLFSIRSDKLSLLNKFTDYFPSVLKSCYELQPLNNQQARQAIEAPAKLSDKMYASQPFTFADEALILILNSLTETKYNREHTIADYRQEIETFQLQIVCTYAENLVIEKQLSKIEANDLGNIKSIFENHYRNIITRLSTDKQLPARRLMEEKLIIDGARVSMPVSYILKDPGMTKELLDELINTHIIRPEQDNSVEISHDTLIEPILKYYDERRKQETLEKELQEKEAQIKKISEEQEARAKRNKLITRIVGVAFIITFVFAWYALIKSKEAEKQKNIAVQLKTEADRKKDSVTLLSKRADSLSQQLAANSNIVNQIVLGSYTNESKDSIAQNSSASVIALSRAYNEYQAGAKEIPSQTNKGPFVSKYMQSVTPNGDEGWNTAFVVWCFTYNEAMKTQLSEARNAGNPRDFLNVLASQGYVINAPPEKQMPGDIVFFDFGEHKGAQACGIVFNIDINKGLVYSIEGDFEARVKTVARYINDVMSYARITETRIYLLTGNIGKTGSLQDLQKELILAGYKVLGGKYLVDPGRPDQGEIRYFNSGDREQAKKIAMFMQTKYPGQIYTPKQYVASTAKPGYIEIWLGR